MRYERQVVLEMQPGSGVPVASSPSAVPAGAVDVNSVSVKPPVAADNAGKSVVKPSVKAAVKPADKMPPVVATHSAVTKPAAKPPVHVKAQSEVAFDAPVKKSVPKATTHATAAKHKPVATKPPAGTTQSHTPQV